MRDKTSFLGRAVLNLVAVSALSMCRTIPRGATAVKPFSAEKYLGRWYEIARLDFRFERGLNNTTAEYSFNDDGSIRVINRGFNYKSKKWKEAKGKAKFVSAADEGKLKVSFFGPFYSGYNVIAIDSEYRYALVAGKSTKYLWLLSREKTMPENIRQNYLDKAKNIGYKIDELIWVVHDK